MLHTSTLSTKNQVTVPGKARALLPAEDTVFYGRTHGLAKESTGEVFPLLLLMSGAELERRELAIRSNPRLTPVQQETLAMKLRAGIAEMALDQQNRLVLPAQFREHLGLDRSVGFVVMLDSLRVWNPEHFARWADLVQTPTGVAYDPSLDDVLFLPAAPATPRISGHA